MSTPRPATYSYKTERHVLDTPASARSTRPCSTPSSLGDSFGPLAVIDRLIETGYLARADNGADATPHQARIYRWIARSRS